MADRGNDSASDIITYIGVPLAVLGVLPILYNTIATLAALSRIRRTLRHARLKALTRSDVVNRIIEVELPRYAVTPLDRSLPSHRRGYWALASHPSPIPGGSWSLFNWRSTAIGARVQRVEYPDQLRQPQAEVAFEDLVCYLLDLGAVPDPHGWRLLRNTGLWTPVGCSLMRGPEDAQPALTIAGLDDSDGHLSLAVAWSSHWTTRDHTSLPPYWVRLPAAPPLSESPGAEAGGSAAEASSAAAASRAGSSSGNVGDDLLTDMSSEKGTEGPEQETSSASKKAANLSDHAETPAYSRGEAIACKFSARGLVTAVLESSPGDTPAAHSSTPDMLPPYTDDLGLYIEHLRCDDSAHRGLSAPYSSSPSTPTSPGTWFASAATAYGTSPHTILWNYRIPDAILSFTRRDTLPCGVLESVGLVNSSDTPSWGTTSAADGAEGRAIDAMNRRLREQREALEKERRMTPEERALASRQRIEREAFQRFEEFRERNRVEAHRRETRLLEALQSPKWSPKQLAPHALRWLHARPATTTLFPSPSATPEEAMGPLLRQMVLDGALAARVAAALDAWKAWAENGGMRRADLDELVADKAGEVEALALAALVAAVIGRAGSGPDTVARVPSVVGGGPRDTLGADLQECLRLWPKVRLG